MTAAAYPEEIRRALGGHDPTEEQWRAISAPLEPCVVIAGAGSGKTSVIAARVVYLALAAQGRFGDDARAGGVLPGNVLCLTFTNKATENLQLRVRRALGGLSLPEGEEPTVVNYHSFAAQILDRHGLLAGIEPGQRVLTEAQRAELCARVLDEVTFEHVEATWQPSLVSKILELADQAANHRVEPRQILEFNERRLDELAGYRTEKAYLAALERIELVRAVERFQELKRGLGVIDFGDQITLALRIVERYPDVGSDYRSRFHAVVLDEYQDTNVVQAQLIVKVFGSGYPVTAVGDPDQSIYGWRGASLFNLLEFPQQFRLADGREASKLPLYTNFRSGARILAAADRIIQKVPAAQRPAPDKRLEPWAANGTGEVELGRFTDEWSEAGWIGERIAALRGGGDLPRWSDVAVLCRTSRLFVPLQEAFAERGIPVEVVGLAGLVKTPEVQEVLAYARAAADPFASVSLAKILLGPRYRVGFKDLARVAAWAKDRNYALRDADRDETAPFLFAEALEHLDEVEEQSNAAGYPLSAEGRARLEEFRRELAELRDEARRPVGEFLAEVIRRTGLLAELDAWPDQVTAGATKRNLSAFLDEVHAFSPLEGELTLRAFLDYLDTVEASESKEWAPVQPSTDDSVKVMTIHQAKGLEFDTVFVPGLAKGLLPNLMVPQNPAERGKSLDFELRGDAQILPTFKGNLRQFYFELREFEEMEERRTCYVALTRAKRRLMVTGAHWYGDDTQKAKDPSMFFDELAEWARETEEATIEQDAEVPEGNPLEGYRRRFVKDWPGPARSADEWRERAAQAERDPTLLDHLVESLPPEEAEDFARRAAELDTLASALLERERAAPKPRSLPQSIAVGGVIEYARCPLRFYWSHVRPLPRFSGPAARLGTQVHSWIERRSSGQASLLELDEQPDLTAEELAGEPGKLERLQRAWQDSRFSRATPLYAERPFLLSVEGFTVSGRIDAIFGEPTGRWEVVDYKTGREPDHDDPLARLQLDIYALACADVWRKSPEDLTLTYCYLATGVERSWPAGPVDETRERVAAGLRGVAARDFDPTPGPYCRWCDFLPFCPAGRAHVGDEGLEAATGERGA